MPRQAETTKPAAPPLRIAPTPERPEPTPPVGGAWLTHPDGGLAPADEETARAAGLGWAGSPNLPPAAPAPSPDTPQE
jgi:hypothetical protein